MKLTCLMFPKASKSLYSAMTVLFFIIFFPTGKNNFFMIRINQMRPCLVWLYRIKISIEPSVLAFEYRPHVPFLVLFFFSPVISKLKVCTPLSASIRPWIRHSVAVITGLIAAAHFFYTNVAYLVALAGLSYFVLALSHGTLGHSRGPLITVTCLTFNLVVEFWLATPVDWHQIRGAQMILTMKMISLGFDFDRENQRIQKADQEKATAQTKEEPIETPVTTGGLRMRDRRAKRGPIPNDPDDSSETKSDVFQVDYRRRPTLFEHLGYAINPGTTVFGPWISYHDYMASFHRPIWVCSCLGYYEHEYLTLINLRIPSRRIWFGSSRSCCLSCTASCS